MVKIYGTENSRAMRPIWTAEEMGLDYELIMMPFPPRVFMKEYLDINIAKDIPIKNISIDTRTIKKESLFIAIKGDKFDGNNFVEEAFKKGACLAIVDDKKLLKKSNKNIKITKYNLLIN